MDIISAYQELGSYRAAARLCGRTHKTAKRVLARRMSGTYTQRERPALVSNTDAVQHLVAKKVRSSDGLITAKRLPPMARAAGNVGSLGNLRRAVARAKADWRRRRRVYRPWQPLPGEHLVVDWAERGRLHFVRPPENWSIRCGPQTLNQSVRPPNLEPFL